MSRRRKKLIRSGRRIFAALVLGIGAAVPAVAYQQICAPRSGMVDTLADKYRESLQSMGLTSDNKIVEVFASPETGTWTIIISSAAGMACVVASGQAFALFSDGLPKPGDDL